MEILFFSTVRIETEGPKGVGCGTGFLVAHTENGEAAGRIFLVTNKHVVGDATIGRFFFIAQKPDGTPDITQRREFTVMGCQAPWVGHPDPAVDVTVCNVSSHLNSLQMQGTPAFARWIPTTEFVTDQQMAAEFLPIEEVIVLGYPNGWISNNLPLARRGITATPPALDDEGQPKLVLDVPIFPGSSGSPVCICNVAGYSAPGGLIPGLRFKLLGIVAEFLGQETTGEWTGEAIPTDTKATVAINQNTGLGIAFKARTIRETIDVLLKTHPW